MHACRRWSHVGGGGGGHGDGVMSAAPASGQVARDYNVKVQAMLTSLRAELPGLKLAFVPVYDKMLDLVTNPSKFGQENVEEGCCAMGRFEMGFICNDGAPMTCDDADKYLFRDAFQGGLLHLRALDAPAPPQDARLQRRPRRVRLPLPRAALLPHPWPRRAQVRQGEGGAATDKTRSKSRQVHGGSALVAGLGDAVQSNNPSRPAAFFKFL